MNAELLNRAREVMRGAAAEPDRQAAQIAVKEPPTVNAYTLLAEHDQGDVEQIAALWRRLFGFAEPRAHIEATLRNLRQWQSSAKRWQT